MITGTRQPDSPGRLVRQSFSAGESFFACGGAEGDQGLGGGGGARSSALHLRSRKSAEPDRGLARHQRLTRQLQFEQTYAQQRRFVGQFMVLWCYTGADAALRLGVVASRRIGPAVMRNRAKRRLREAFRLNRPGFQGDMDVVLVARPAVIKAKWDDLVQELQRLATQAGLAASGKKTG